MEQVHDGTTVNSATVARSRSTSLESVPAELRERKQWVTWKYIDRQKVPLRADTGKAASTTDPATWSTYDEASRAAQHRHHAGVGYVFSPDDPYTGIDLDDCLDDAGELSPEAAAIVETMNTYTEVSPSGTGVKMWLKGQVPSSIKTKQIEIYSQGRYFTMTGQHLAGTTDTIRDAQVELMDLYEAVRSAPAPRPEPASSLPLPSTDADHTRRWCLAALEGEHAKMMAAGDGERHNRRFDSAHALGGLIHTGGLTEDEIVGALAVNFGPDQHGAMKTIADGIKAGRERPRTIPAPRPIFRPLVELPTDDDFDALSPDEQRQRYLTLMADRDRWKERAEKLDEWRAWALKVAAIPTERLSPAAKMTAFALYPEMLSRQERGIDEPQKVWIEQDKEKVGASAGSYGAWLKQLDRAGAIIYQLQRNQKGHSRVAIQPAAFFDPDAWMPPEPRNHGGTRTPMQRPVQSCPTHGDDAPVIEEVTEIRTAICGECETILGEGIVTVKRHLLWESAGTQPPCDEPDLQLALHEETGDPPVEQVEGRLEPDTQLAFRPSFSRPGACPAPSIVRPDLYRRHARERNVVTG